MTLPKLKTRKLREVKIWSNANLNSWGSRQGFSEADHAHIIGILFQARRVGTSEKTRKTLWFVSHATARVPTVQSLSTSIAQMFLKCLEIKPIKNQDVWIMKGNPPDNRVHCKHLVVDHQKVKRMKVKWPNRSSDNRKKWQLRSGQNSTENLIHWSMTNSWKKSERQPNTRRQWTMNQPLLNWPWRRCEIQPTIWDCERPKGPKSKRVWHAHISRGHLLWWPPLLLCKLGADDYGTFVTGEELGRNQCRADRTQNKQFVPPFHRRRGSYIAA